MSKCFSVRERYRGSLGQSGFLSGSSIKGGPLSVLVGYVRGIEGPQGSRPKPVLAASVSKWYRNLLLAASSQVCSCHLATWPCTQQTEREISCNVCSSCFWGIPRFPGCSMALRGISDAVTTKLLPAGLAPLTCSKQPRCNLVQKHLLEKLKS